ncbi:MAG: bacterial transcriptional activator domain-containing protein, partial [Actinomycetota bacterium]
APYFLRTVGDRLEIGGSALTVDVWEFERLVEAGATAEDEHRLDEAVGCYVSAVELWRGEPFVDLADVDEVIMRRSDLTSRALVAATRAAELLVAKGDHAAATRMARRALEIDELDEAAHRAAIAAAYYQGDRAGLDVALARLDGALAELRVEPSAETAMLLELVSAPRAA